MRLLYAQPITRISRLKVNDIADDGTGMTIALQTTPATVPPPVAALLRAHLSSRPNMNTAANESSDWVFPGYRAGQPIMTAYPPRRIPHA